MLGKALWKLGMSPQSFDTVIELGKAELVYANVFWEAMVDD